MTPDKIVVVAIPILEEDEDGGSRHDGWCMECTVCGMVGFINTTEDEVHNQIMGHMQDSHGVSPDGFAYKEV